MPRNVLVKFQDGTVRRYVNAPDNVTPQQMQAFAEHDYGKSPVAAMDGGRPAPRPAPAAPQPKTSAGGAIWRGLEDAVPFRNYLQAATNEAGSALGLNNTPSSMSYLDRVRALKADHDQLEAADREQHPIAHYAGEAGGLVIGGGGTGAAAKLGLTKLAPRAVTAVANVLQRSRLARVAAASAGGAAGGATYAAGDANPEDAGTAAEKGGEAGAILGPVAGVAAKYVARPAAGLGLRMARAVTSPFSDFLRLPDAANALSNITSATTDQIAAKAKVFRQATGAEPTVFELLPLADRNRILSQVASKNDGVAEQTAAAIKARAANVGPEMSAQVRGILQPNRDAIDAKLLGDLRTARGGQLEPGDTDLVGRAMESPTDMSSFRDAEARAIMAPHDDTQVTGKFSDLLPQMPVNKGKTVEMIDADPAVSAALKSAVPGGYRAAGKPVSVADISSMIETLKGDLGKGGIEGRTAQQAIEHLQGVLGDNAPEAAAAHQQMTDAYAARSRMMEGMQAGSRTQLRNDVQVGTNRGQARLVTNAYDSPEGQNGLVLGQSNKVISDLGGSPPDALRTTADISRNGIGRELDQNLGPDAAGKIAAAAGAQDQSAQALGAALGKVKGGGSDTSDLAHTLVQTVAALHPTSFVTTKLGALQKLRSLVSMPENRAKTIVDMLFSQDPAMTQRAIGALGNDPNGVAFLKFLPGAAGVASEGQGQGATAPAGPGTALPGVPPMPGGPDAASLPDVPAMPGVAADNATNAAPAADPSQSPYASMLDHYKATENPDLVALGQRMWGQESGHHQFGRDGKPLTSSKGAVGVAQVEPTTGPEAAAYFGLPWDPNAFAHDPAYNELLGYAYLAKQLHAHGGDPTKAAASYNAGPGRADASFRTGAALPAETQDYVERVAS